jgi:hypothetical protein
MGVAQQAERLCGLTNGLSRAKRGGDGDLLMPGIIPALRLSLNTLFCQKIPKCCQ